MSLLWLEVELGWEEDWFFIMADLSKDMFDSPRFLKSTVESSWVVLVYDTQSNSGFPDSNHFWYFF